MPCRTVAIDRLGATLELRALTVGEAYWVAIESFDETGVPIR
jgi:hypothetical protein